MISLPRKIFISVFILFWIFLFHYESLRAFYLIPLTGRQLPKFPLLFPPAGWIMFYEIENEWSTAEVYGLNAKGEPEFIDPHKIFETRFVGFDNIRRNIMVSVLDPRISGKFCGYLRRKFPQYPGFQIVHAGYPDLVTRKPPKKYSQVLYQC